MATNATATEEQKVDEQADEQCVESALRLLLLLCEDDRAVVETLLNPAVGALEAFACASKRFKESYRGTDVEKEANSVREKEKQIVLSSYCSDSVYVQLLRLTSLWCFESAPLRLFRTFAKCSQMQNKQLVTEEEREEESRRKEEKRRWKEEE